MRFPGPACVCRGERSGRLTAGTELRVALPAHGSGVRGAVTPQDATCEPLEAVFPPPHTQKQSAVRVTPLPFDEPNGLAVNLQLFLEQLGEECICFNFIL